MNRICFVSDPSATNCEKQNRKKHLAASSTARAAKFEHAYSYIQRHVQSEVVDRSAYRGQDRSIYLPFSKHSIFYHEYNYFCELNGIVEKAMGRTFRRAYNVVVKQSLANDNIVIKLSGGKGAYVWSI